MKLINRRSAIMALTKQMSDGTDYRNEIVEQCISAIQELKVHDFKERKTGKWKFQADTMYHYECPFCRYLHQYKDNFCPLCGAKMEGEA